MEAMESGVPSDWKSSLVINWSRLGDNALLTAAIASATSTSLAQVIAIVPAAIDIELCLPDVGGFHGRRLRRRCVGERVDEIALAEPRVPTVQPDIQAH